MRAHAVRRRLRLALDVQREAVAALRDVQAHVRAVAVEAAAIEAAQADVHAERLVLDTSTSNVSTRGASVKVVVVADGPGCQSTACTPPYAQTARASGAPGALSRSDAGKSSS